MALHHGTPNPLNYFGLRRVDFPPPHFVFFNCKKSHVKNINQITEWIEFNLNNRYYVGQGIMLDNTNTIVYNTRIGFESEMDLTFFTIACPLLY